MIPITIYFTQNGVAGGQIAPSNQGVVRQIPASLNPITAALDQYFNGPSAEERARGLIAVRNGFSNYRRLVLGNGVLRVYLDGQCQTNGSSDSIAQPLIATLKQIPGVTYVKLFDEHDHTRDLLGPADSWPVCLDVLFTPTFAPSATQTMGPKPSSAPTAAPLLSRTATATHGVAANAGSTPASTQSIIPTVTPSRPGGRTATPAPSGNATRTAATATIDAGCNRAKFISDVTIADNTILHVGESFVKTWRIQNAGTCPWSDAYQLVFAGGDKMPGPVSVSLPMGVAPDETVDISVNLSAPTAPGQYQGLWLLQSPDGRTFGVGASATGHLWVKITVIAPALPTPASTAASPVGQPTESLGVAAPVEIETSTPSVPSVTAEPSVTATVQSTQTTLPTAFLTPAFPTSVPAVAKTAVPARASQHPLPTLQQILDQLVSFLMGLLGAK